MRRKNILFTAVDIGGRIETYSNYIQRNFGNQLKCESFVKFKVPQKHYKTEYTYNFAFQKQPKPIQWLISLLFFLYAIFKYDVIYIISGENILTRKLLKLELWIYKKLQKKVIMHFVGADIRNNEYLKWKGKYFINDASSLTPEKQSKFQKKLTKLSQKYANKVILTSPDLIEFFDEKKIIFIPVFIDINKFLSELPITSKNSTPTILHAPSNPALKGSKYIEEVLKKIKQKFPDINIILTTRPEYNNSIHPPYTVTKYRLYELYKISNIVIDQLSIGWYGMQSVESALANNITICLIERKYLPYVNNQNCPITFIHDVSELEEALIYAVKNQNLPVDTLDWVKSTHTIDHSEQFKMIIEFIQNEY